MKEILIIGAKSDIAIALAREYAKRYKDSYKLVLCARNVSSLEYLQNEIIESSKIACELRELDVADFNTHKAFIESFSNLYGVIYVAGIMPSQTDMQDDFNLAKQCLEVNTLGAISLLELSVKKIDSINSYNSSMQDKSSTDHIMPSLRGSEATKAIHNTNQKTKGFIIAISSVAADRGRASNYIYGASKAALSAFMSGLHHRMSLETSGIKILNIHCGYVLTNMTKHLKLPKPLCAMPESVAKDILNALDSNKSKIYTKGVWKWIMLLIRCMPTSIFKRMRF